MLKTSLALIVAASPAFAGPELDLFNEMVSNGAQPTCSHIEESPFIGMDTISQSGQPGSDEYEGFGGDLAAIYDAGNGLVYVVDRSKGEEVCFIYARLRK